METGRVAMWCVHVPIPAESRRTCGNPVIPSRSAQALSEQTKAKLDKHRGEGRAEVGVSAASYFFLADIATFTETGFEAIPFATAYNVAAPVSIPAGTVK